MSIEANYMAPYVILAPGLTRSRFSDLRIQGANSVGLSCNYGWCDLGPARTVLAPHQELSCCLVCGRGRGLC